MAQGNSWCMGDDRRHPGSRRGGQRGHDDVSGRGGQSHTDHQASNGRNDQQHVDVAPGEGIDDLSDEPTETHGHHPNDDASGGGGQGLDRRR